jgi:hypothetical protein
MTVVVERDRPTGDEAQATRKAAATATPSHDRKRDMMMVLCWCDPL